jgi:hypothetical protein
MGTYGRGLVSAHSAAGVEDASEGEQRVLTDYSGRAGGFGQREGGEACVGEARRVEGDKGVQGRYRVGSFAPSLRLVLVGVL